MTRLSLFAALAVMIANPIAVQAQSTLYDDFGEKSINPSKWYGTGTDPLYLDATREIAAIKGVKALTLSGIGYAPTSDDMNADGGAWGLTVVSPADVTAFLLNFTVTNAQAVACAKSKQSAATSVTFQGSFFNTQSNPTSLIGDVVADISAVRYNTDTQTGPLTVVGDIWECTSSDCGQQTSIYYNNAMGSVPLATASSMGVSWNTKNSDFVISVNGTKTTVPYTVQAQSAPYYPYKYIAVQRYVPDCTASKRPYTNVGARIASVYVN